MKKYTIEVLMNTSNTYMGSSDQTKEFTILADGVTILDDVVYKFYVIDKYNISNVVAYYPVNNTLITKIEDIV